MATVRRPRLSSLAAFLISSICVTTIWATTMWASASWAGAPSPPRVDVVPDAQGGGASGVIHASVDVDAPQAVVWRIMIDCGQVARLLVNVKLCRVVDRDPAGRWEVREQITRGSMLPAVRTVIRSDFDPMHTVRFHRIDGDFKVLEGEWRLEPLDGGLRTRVFYESRMSAPFSAPSFLIRAILRKDIPNMLANLRDASEQQAGAVAPAGDRRP